MEKIFPETLCQLMLDVLNKSPLFVYIKDIQPFLISFDGKEYYVYVKNLSSAYFKDRPDTTRAQLPIKDDFDKIKNTSIPFIFLGYDQENDVLVCWNIYTVKERLNEKKSVSFYSRKFFQEEVKSGELLIKNLTNGDKPVFFKRKDLIKFFTEIETLFSPKMNTPKTTSLFEYHKKQALNIASSSNSSHKPIPGKILKIEEKDLIERLRGAIETNHTFEAMKIAERYYNGKYLAMKPKDWLALVKGIDFDEPVINIKKDRCFAAEPFTNYSRAKSNQDVFVEFMQQSGMSNKTINNYINALKGRISKGIAKHLNRDFNDIFSITDPGLLSNWYSALFKIPEFEKLDSVGKNMYSCALKKYIKFIERNPLLHLNVEKPQVITIDESTKTNELKFFNYLLNKGLSANSAKYYTNAMGGKVADCIRANIYPDLHNIYSIRDYDTIYKWSLQLCRTFQFIKLDHKGNRQYSCAIKHYLEFLDSYK